MLKVWHYQHTRTWAFLYSITDGDILLTFCHLNTHSPWPNSYILPLVLVRKSMPGWGKGLFFIQDWWFSDFIMKRKSNPHDDSGFILSSLSEPAWRPEEAVLRPAGAAPHAGRGPRPTAGRTQGPLREAAANQRRGSLPAQRCSLLSLCSGVFITYLVSIFWLYQVLQVLKQMFYI